MNRPRHSEFRFGERLLHQRDATLTNVLTEGETPDVIVPFVTVHGAEIEARCAVWHYEALQNAVIRFAIADEERLPQFRRITRLVARLRSGVVERLGHGASDLVRLFIGQEDTYEAVDRRFQIGHSMLGFTDVVINVTAVWRPVIQGIHVRIVQNRTRYRSKSQ